MLDTKLIQIDDNRIVEGIKELKKRIREKVERVLFFVVKTLIIVFIISIGVVIW